jgi:hypothetical protein
MSERARIPGGLSDTAIILGRIEASERNTERVFDAHEERDQERFEQLHSELEEHRQEIGAAIAGLTAEVKRTNGGLATVKGKVAILEDREGQTAKRRGERLSLRHGIYIGVATSVVTALATEGHAIVQLLSSIGH